MTDAPFQTIEWLGLRFKVPADWEIVRHSLSPAKGSLGLVDRRRERMELHWTELEREPDLDHMLRDQQSRELLAEPGSTLGPLHAPGDWRGFWLTSPAGQALARAVLFDAPSARLLEAVIVPDGPDARRLARRVLESVTVGRAEESTRSRAFGLDVTTPPGYRLTSATVKPADVSFEFPRPSPGGKEPGPEEVSVRRMGMAEAWYGDDPEKFVRREAPRVRFRARAERSYGNHRAFSVEGDEPGERLARLIGRGHGRRILIFRCPAENAVYRISTRSRDRRPVWPDEFRVACCRERRVSKPRLDPAVLLDAVPTPNLALRLEPRGSGSCLGTDPKALVDAAAHRLDPPLPFEKGVELDALGRQVFVACDGSRTTEQIVEEFAERHRLRFHEARLSVLTFLRSLVERNLVALVASKDAPP